MKISKTWWGQQFLAALENFTDSGRLARGRSYSTDNRIKTWKLAKGIASATLRGNINPYFGVYKEPTYHVSVKMLPLSGAQWEQVIALFSQKASVISKLLLNDMPESIENEFKAADTHLLPQSYKDFIVQCDCPDYAVPCKHIAGVCYRLAQQFDHNPFLLFEMRGLSPDKLRKELLKSPLGKILAQGQETTQPSLIPAEHLYTRPKQQELPKQITSHQFWQGQKPLPKAIESPQEALIPALVIKKGGDYPEFWQKQTSFISVMEVFYLRMRKLCLRELS